MQEIRIGRRIWRDEISVSIKIETKNLFNEKWTAIHYKNWLQQNYNTFS